MLAAHELDQSFANVYSTAVSFQNLRPLWDRRVLGVVMGALVTAGALVLNIASYEHFLDLLGSVFVPLSAVLTCDFFLISSGRWDLSERSHRRRWPAIAWAAGFVTYQLINPGYIGWCVTAWSSIDRAIGFTVRGWMSASILSFLVAAASAVICEIPGRLRRRRTGHVRAILETRRVAAAISAWRMNGPFPFVVAIDGYGSAGKTTLVAQLRRRLSMTVVSMDDFLRDPGAHRAGMATR